MFQKYRIPTIIGLVILIAGMGVGIFVVRQPQTALFPQAAPEFTPKQVRLTNISENSFSVSWVTDEPTIGFVQAGKAATSLDQTFGDDRDQASGNTGNWVIHHVTVRSLAPGTGYYYKLGSGPARMTYDNQGQPYQVNSATVLGTPPPADTAYGTVLGTTGEPVRDAVVYLQLPGAVPVSAVVQDNGNWVIALSTARTTDLSHYITYDASSTREDVLVQAAGGTTTAVTNTANDAPVPTMTLGRTYDFRSTAADNQATASATTASPEATSQFSFTPLVGQASESSASGTTVTVLNPPQDGITVSAVRPEFMGQGPAGTTLTVKVQSPVTYTGTVTVKSDGTWDWTPPKDLAPGQHTITITFTDNQGKPQTLTRNFVVAAAGTSGLPSFVASPSATVAPTATPAARKSIPATGSGIPTSGTLTPTLILFILGIVMMSGGIFWQLKKGFLPHE